MHDTQGYEPSKVRRSFTLLSMDVICYVCGLAFIDQSTVLPTFLGTLTGSSILIGAITAIRPAAAFLPQLWTAHYLRNHRLHKPYLIKWASVSRISTFLFAGVLFISKPTDRTLMLCSFLIMYAAFWLSEGMVGVSWTDLVAKTIPERMRGRLFGYTQVGGGILAIFAGILASAILAPNGPRFPGNYAILILVASVFFALSLASLCFIHEPEGAPEDNDGNFLEYIRKIGKMIGEHGQLKRFLAVQLLMGCFGMSLPFYILYAKEVSGISGGMVGILLAIQVAGSIIWSAVAGYASDHRGPKSAILMTILAGISAPLLALILRSPSIWLYGSIFFAVGAVTGSTWIGLTNFLLELAADDERRTYIGVMNTANAPTMIFPILGGLIVQMVSYKAVFVLTFISLLAAFFLAMSLKLHRTAGGK